MLNKIITENEVELEDKLATLIEKVSNESISVKNSFYIGLSGGSLVKYLTSSLQKVKTDFTKWTLFFCDERVVSFDNSESTYGVYKKNLLPKVPLLKEEQFIKIKQGISAEDAAKNYNEQLVCIFGGEELPQFDMLLLGMGPDGHTCSLFPNHELLNESKVWIAPITDSPKPPPERITMTYPLINNAKNCIFAMSGTGKAEMVKRILVDGEQLPAGRVQPKHGQLYWILDKEAAKYLL